MKTAWKYSWLLLAAVQLNAESVPTNVPDGFLPPLTEVSHFTQRVLLSVAEEPPSGSNYVLQQSSELDGNWNDAAELLEAGGFLKADTALTSQFFRLKSLYPNTPPFSLAIRGIQDETSRTLGFPLLAGWEHWLQVKEATSGDWRNLSITTNELFTVSQELAGKTLRILAKPPVDREAYEAILVAGQSNGMISDDIYYWDRDTNVLYLENDLRFRHPARYYDGLKDIPWAYSFANGGAGLLSEHNGRRYLMVGVAVGGTPMSQWMPATDRFDRSTLFGRANFRRVAAAPQQISAIWYYGHESSCGSGTYIEEWKNLIREFQKDAGPVPVIFAQLSKTTTPGQQCLFGAAEQQRMSEEGQVQGTEGHHMVVAFDLPLGDGLHLSGEGNRILGIRFARAMREHVYGEPVDGTGPRLVSVTHADGDTLVIRVTFTQVINEPVAAYDDQFRVRDEEGEIKIIGLTRSGNGRSVDLKLRQSPAGIATVSYGEPAAAGNNHFLTNVVRNSEGLPAPAFGPQKAQ